MTTEIKQAHLRIKKKLKKEKGCYSNRQGYGWTGFGAVTSDDSMVGDMVQEAIGVITFFVL